MYMVKPREMTEGDIHEAIDAYGKAAARGVLYFKASGARALMLLNRDGHAPLNAIWIIIDVSI